MNGNSLVQRMIEARERKRLERLAQWTGRSLAELLEERRAQEARRAEQERIEAVVEEVAGRLGLIRGRHAAELERVLSAVFERVGARVFRENAPLIAREISARLKAVAVPGEEVPAASPAEARIPADDIQGIIDHLIRRGSPV